MGTRDLRIVSLIPSGTEIVAALGLLDRLVGRSHECDFPPAVAALPACTRPAFETAGSSAEIDRRVRALLDDALAVYALETDRIAELAPTHIVTQDQCDVCAVSLAEVERAVAEGLARDARVVTLHPGALADVWADMTRLGRALGADGEGLVAGLRDRLRAIAAGLPPSRPRVACIEWTDPLMAAGNWVPELVAIAGGEEVLGPAGGPSPTIEWARLAAADADVIVVMPCGYDLARSRAAAAVLAARPEWRALRAVRAGNVFLTDGNQYFNRPGPRLVESVEILAEILHPEAARFGHQGEGWERFPACR